MRLNDLTDPTQYIPAEADLGDFLNQIDGLWPNHIDVRCHANAAAPAEEKIFDAIGHMSFTRHWLNR